VLYKTYEVECPACGCAVPLAGYDFVRKSFVGQCPACCVYIGAVGLPGAKFEVTIMFGPKPKQETWRDRALRDPMM
jgi:hypothetical protein